MTENIRALDNIACALVMVVLLLVSMRKKGGYTTRRDRILFWLTVSVMAMLVLEVPYVLFNGFARFQKLNYWANIIYHATQITPPLIFILYIDYIVFRSMRHLRRKALYCLPFALLFISLSLVNIVTGAFFIVDSEGFYRRQFLMPLMFVLQYVPIVYALWFLFDARRRIDRKNFGVLLFFPVPAVISSILQFFVPGLTLVWPAVSLGLIALYMSLQNRQLTEDYLTGAYNRRALDEYLQSKVRHCEPGKTFSAFMIDLDKFKKINDRLGHKTGDEALVESVQILRRAVRSSDFIARYAGDEFVIVLDSTDENDLQNVVMRINQEADRSNSSGARYYNLGFSIGTGIFDPLVDQNIENFMKRIDQYMYEIKRKKKNSMFVT